MRARASGIVLALVSIAQDDQDVSHQKTTQVAEDEDQRTSRGSLIVVRRLRRADQHRANDYHQYDQNADDRVHDDDVDQVSESTLPGEVVVALRTDLVAIERLRSELQPVAAQTALRSYGSLGGHDFRWSVVQLGREVT